MEKRCHCLKQVGLLPVGSRRVFYIPYHPNDIPMEAFPDPIPGNALSGGYRLPRNVKEFSTLRASHQIEMKDDRDGRSTYRNCTNCLDAELTSAYIFDCPSILADLHEIGVLFSSKNYYVDNIEHIAGTVIWVHGTVRFAPVLDTTVSY
ncbi:hypothetical protein TNCV_4158061 [Trichonephila clavipes]|nr:hypothetical protein TNCV_4158061 [Trichonephila clavipes]